MTIEEFVNGCHFMYCAEEYECIGKSKHSIMAKKLKDGLHYVIEWEDLDRCKPID